MTVEPIKQIREFVRFFDDACAAYEYSQNRLMELNDYIQDLLHEAELDEKKDRTQAHAFYRTLRSARQERRQCKEELELLKPVIDWILANHHLKGKLTQLQGALSSIQDRQKNRQYRPRIRRDDHDKSNGETSDTGDRQSERQADAK